jgi:hypothetical protein
MHVEMSHASGHDACVGPVHAWSYEREGTWSSNDQISVKYWSNAGQIEMDRGKETKGEQAREREREKEKERTRVTSSLLLKLSESRLH